MSIRFLSHLEKNKKKIIFIVAAIFILLISLLATIISRSPIHIEISSTEAIKSLPYATWTTIKEKKTGVTKHDPRLSYKGINIYLSENMSGGYLLDMNGNILHTFLDKRGEKSNWHLIKPYQNNNLLVFTRGETGLFMIDWDSNVKWIKKIHLHHDFAVADNGDIYALIDKKTYSPMFDLMMPIRDNDLAILTKNGEIKKKISFAKMILHNKVLFSAFKKQKKKYITYNEGALDIFHTNTIEIIDKDVFSRDKKLFKKGDVLFCIKYLNFIGVIDVKKEGIIWSWGMDVLDWPHHPSLLENGNILIFDNGTNRGYSRIIELNPVSEEIEWKYEANPPESFYSPTKGSAQRLPNGNTLITESDKGLVFEVTKDGEIVWKFYNPEIDETQNKRATIYRMMRITNPEKYPRLKELKW